MVILMSPESPGCRQQEKNSQARRKPAGKHETVAFDGEFAFPIGRASGPLSQTIDELPNIEAIVAARPGDAPDIRSKWRGRSGLAPAAP